MTTLARSLTDRAVRLRATTQVDVRNEPLEGVQESASFACLMLDGTGQERGPSRVERHARLVVAPDVDLRPGDRVRVSAALEGEATEWQVDGEPRRLLRRRRTVATEVNVKAIVR